MSTLFWSDTSKLSGFAVIVSEYVLSNGYEPGLGVTYITLALRT